MFGSKKPPQQTGGLGAALAAANKVRAENNRIIARLAQDYLKEKKSARRWRLGKFVAVLCLIAAVLWHYPPTDPWSRLPHTALVDINGVIASEAENADQINRSLRRAFAAQHARGVVLRINSPGGSPVQAAEINRQIGLLKKQYPQKPLYAVIADICTSGGYYVAVAADQIYANRASLVGSIGVRLDGFGFVESLHKLGIERRLLTAGDNKAILDPFLPQDAAQTRHVETVLRQIHQQFIAAVKLGRGARLAENEDLFSGLFWSGEQARELGLIDQFGGLEKVAREVIGAKRIVDYTEAPRLLNRFAKQLGGVISQTLVVSQLALARRNFDFTLQ